MTNPLRILVIDDEEDICDLTRLLLERSGYDVTSLTDSRAALRLLDEQPFDLVITDMLMPDRDGLEVMKDVRREHPGVKIIASSGGGRISSNSYLQIARKSGANAVLPKPFTHKELLATIEQALAPAATATQPTPHSAAPV